LRRKDPEEEFFMLSIVSLKMIHSEDSEEYEAEYIYQINPKKLFDHVRE
jgi:hypothetical protein